MTSYDEALALGVALGCILTGLVATALWMQRKRPDTLPVNPDWPEVPETPTPDLLACQCQNCRRIRCVDRRWMPESIVPLPAGCRVSHGLCPSCERRMHAEIDAMTTAAK